MLTRLLIVTLLAGCAQLPVPPAVEQPIVFEEPAAGPPMPSQHRPAPPPPPAPAPAPSIDRVASQFSDVDHVEMIQIPPTSAIGKVAKNSTLPQKRLHQMHSKQRM